jgi:hypothetical protein
MHADRGFPTAVYSSSPVLNFSRPVNVFTRTVSSGCVHPTKKVNKHWLDGACSSSIITPAPYLGSNTRHSLSGDTATRRRWHSNTRLHTPGRKEFVS